MARRFHSFLPVAGNLKVSLKIKGHLSQGYVDIFYILGLACARQAIALQSLFYLDVAILGRLTPLPMRRSSPQGVTPEDKGKIVEQGIQKKTLGFMLRKAIRHHEFISSKMTG
jgi:hypothetical protein